MKILSYTAKICGTVEENLRNEGCSSKIITNLRKELCLIVDSNNLPLKTIDKLNIGDKYTITLKDTIKRPIPDYNLPLQFVYEDDDIAVINKPFDLAVISSLGYRRNYSLRISRP